MAAPPVDAQPFIGVMGIQGRNGSDTAFLIPNQQCLDAVNVDWYRSSLGRKRGGSTALSLATGGTAFASGTLALIRHVPAADQTLAEFWAFDGANAIHRLAASATWVSPTVLDAVAGSPQEVNAVSFNGKLYLAYKSAHNRLHVWDPVDNSVRRVGLDLPAVATLSGLAAGAVTDTRKYRVAWTKQIAGVTVLRSNLSVASASQVLAAQQITITRGTPPGEGETHWEVYGASTSSTFGDWRLLATTAIATATYADNTATLPSTVNSDDGANTPPPSAKYLVSDDARVIMAGAYEAATNAENAMAPKNNRVWWTSILGASLAGDDERVSNTGVINNYADVEEAITGLTQPMQFTVAQSNSLERGSFYVFSFESQWKFVSTGVANVPYLRFRVTGGGGCIHHKSIVSAADDNGNPAIYWWSRRGPMRITAVGQEFLGEDIIDLTATLNLDATIPCHSVYHAAIHQIWFFIATGTSLYPNLRVVFDTRLGKVVDITGVRHGWSQHNGEGAKAYCSCLFSNSVGVAMGRSLKPYIGYTGANEIWKCDTTDLDDNGTSFQAYIDSKSYAPWGLGKRGGMTDNAAVLAATASGVSVQLTIYRDEGVESMISQADLTDHSESGAAVRVMPRFEDSKLADSFSFRCRIGDAQAIANTWNLEGLIVPVTDEGDI